MTAIQPQIRSLSLDALVLSQSPIQVERRAQFDKDALKEMSVTIKANGRVEQPITVRMVSKPSRSETGQFEVADGERRVLATELAGLEEILAEVRELTDEQVEEIQIVTGLQKEKLHELVEAEGYETLHKRGLSVEEIAHKCAKSTATVYARMKLLALGKFGRDCFRGGEIDASIALLAARIPVPAAQIEFVKKALPGGRWKDSDAMTYREALDVYHREFTLDLKGAPFPTDDAQLVPAAGACGTCPKNTLSQPGLFADVSTKALCTDRPCFAQKKAAYVQVRIDEAKERGQQVFEGKDAKKIAPNGDYSMEEGYVRLDRHSHEVPGKTYKQLLGQAAKPDLVVVPENGELVEVALKSAVLKAAREAGLLNKDPKRTQTAKSSGKAEREKAEREREIDDEVGNRLLLRVRQADGGKLTSEYLRYTVAHLMSAGGAYDDEPLVKEHGIKAFAFYTENIKQLQKFSDQKLTRILLDVLYLSDLEFEAKNPNNLLRSSATRLKIDEKKIRAEVQASLQPPPAPAKASKKKAGKK